MSEFRIFCIAAFSGAGTFATAINYGLVDHAFKGNAEALFVMAFVIGCAAVALFGGRHRHDP